MTTTVLRLRWLCVLPGALLAAFLVAFPIHWIVMLIHLFDRFFGRPDDSVITNTDTGKSGLAAFPPEALERLGQAFCAPFAIVAVGALIAPRYRFRTAVALTAFSVIGLILPHLFVASWGFQMTGGWIQRSFTYILHVAGFASALYYVLRNEKAREAKIFVTTE